MFQSRPPLIVAPSPPPLLITLQLLALERSDLMSLLKDCGVKHKPALKFVEYCQDLQHEVAPWVATPVEAHKATGHGAVANHAGGYARLRRESASVLNETPPWLMGASSTGSFNMKKKPSPVSGSEGGRMG